MSIIGIVGSRRRNGLHDFLATEVEFRKVYQPGDRIVSGGCPQGGDRFAEIISLLLAQPGEWTVHYLWMMSLSRRHAMIKAYGAPITIHHAEWVKRGRGAGHYRNTFIARDADVLIACVAPDRTGGTEDTITKFERRTGRKAILVPLIGQSTGDEVI